VSTPDPRAELASLAAAFRTHLAHRSRSGLQGVPPGPSPRFGTTATIDAPVAPEPASSDSAVRLQVIRDEIGDCQRCKLAPTRTNIVFGVGNPQAELVFVGEAPGVDEDKQGEPFVGKAGQLLTRMIEAMGKTRQDVYICNVIKCRPPQNRNPEPDEVQACEGFLKQQLAVLNPRIIVALGKFAAHALCGEDTPISRLRGNLRSYQGIPVMPTYHPAYLLRTPDAKRDAWADLQQVMLFLQN
jgi:uracil-DNA glycosylase